MKKIYTSIKTGSLLLLLLGGAIITKAQDTTPPVITYTSRDTSCIQIGTVFILKNLSVTDNVTDSSNIVVELTWPSGALNSTMRKSYQLDVKATDEFGNSSYKTINFKVDDCIAPTINLNTKDSICHQIRTPYYSTLPTVSDNYYSANQVSISLKSGYVNANVSGWYEEIYEAVDASGNTTLKSRYVYVGECMASSVKQVQAQNFVMYPNPAKDQLYIQSYTNTPSLTIRIIGIDGKVVMTQTLSGSECMINTSSLCNGIYTVMVENNTGVFQSKLEVLH